MADDITGGRRGERATGTPNTIYDLSSVLFHALEGGASYDTFIEDAEQEGDQELADFFRQVRDEDGNRADQAQRLLAERTPTADQTGGATTGVGAAEGPATVGATERRPDMDAAPTGPDIGAGRGEPDVSPPRTEPTGAPPAREEDRGLLDRAREALGGEDQPRREETGSTREEPRDPRRDDPLTGRP